VEETLNQVAVMRGPMVYCLEAPESGGGAGIFDVAIPTGIRLEPRHDAALWGGTSVLEGTAARIVREGFGDSLYRTMRPLRREPFSLRLIPYYAWANRGVSYMTVWMPLAP
jgi:DUF1680 family protein